MRIDPKSAVIFLAALFAAAPALGCELRLSDGTRAEGLADLPDGISAGAVECGSRRLSAQFWTLTVDGSKPYLGIRDDALFDTQRTGPLTQLVSARLGPHLRVSVQERSDTAALSLATEPQRRHRYRRLATICDDVAGTDPLDCSIGKARIKARVTSDHVDDDGWLDVSMHEISIYDGDSRLHVMSFTTPYSRKATVDIARWIEAIRAVSDLVDEPPIRP